jgi:hypothetical protein
MFPGENYCGNSSEDYNGILGFPENLDQTTLKSLEAVFKNVAFHGKQSKPSIPLMQLRQLVLDLQPLVFLLLMNL